MSLPQAVTEADLHMPHGDLHSPTPHTSHYIPITHNTHTTSTITHDTTTATTPMSQTTENSTNNATTNVPPLTPDTSLEPSINYGYATMPLPELAPTDLGLLSHNINTLNTTTSAELGATFDTYEALQPTIIGLQETNKNWSLYDKTEGPLRTIINQRWYGARTVTAHCKDTVFNAPHQPGGIAQFVLRKIMGRVTKHGCDDLGRYAWQQIILDGK